MTVGGFCIICRLIFERASQDKNGAITFLGHVFHYWFCITYSITGIRVWTLSIKSLTWKASHVWRAAKIIVNYQKDNYINSNWQRKLKLIYISRREDNWIRDIQFFNWPFDLKNKTGMYYLEVYVQVNNYEIVVNFFSCQQ